MIPEVLQTVGILGIEVSGDSFCFENGAIIIPSLNRPTSAVDGDGDVRGGQKKRCVDFIKTEDKSEDAEGSCIEDACHPTSRRLKKAKVAHHDDFGKNTEAEDASQAEEAGVSKSRYISTSILTKYSNFSRFYKKKLGPF